MLGCLNRLRILSQHQNQNVSDVNLDHFFQVYHINHLTRATDPEDIQDRLDESYTLLERNHSSDNGALVSSQAFAYRRMTIRAGELIVDELLQAFEDTCNGLAVNVGNLTVHRSCDEAEVLDHDEFLCERCDTGGVFFAALAGRGDQLEFPEDGTVIVGDIVFVADKYSDMSHAGIRERTKDRDLNGSTNKVQSVKFKDYHLLVVGKNEELNLVAVKFARKESMVAFLPSDQVQFVEGTKAFVALGNVPSNATFSTDLCEYLSLNHLQGRSVDDILFHHGFARGVADRSVPTKRPNGEKGFSVGEISAFLHGITEFGMPRRGGSVTDIVRHYLTSRTTHGINTHVPKKYDHYAPIISLWGVTDIGDREPKWEDFDVAVHSLRFPYTP